MPVYVNVLATTQKSSLRTERKKVTGKSIKNTSEEGRYKAFSIDPSNGFSSGNESEIESVSEVEEVTAKYADN